MLESNMTCLVTNSSSKLTFLTDSSSVSKSLQAGISLSMLILGGT
jgi:hypothetical protein